MRALAGLLLGVVVTGGFLGGCGDSGGFRPLYGPASVGANLSSHMAAIDIAPIPSRIGQRLRNELIFETTGGGVPAPRTYRLEIAIKESLGSTLVKNTGEALSQVYNLDAQFRLVRISDRKVVAAGASHARAEFERFQQIYSNVRAREDAENRTARQISDDLKTRLAVILSREKV